MDSSNEIGRICVFVATKRLKKELIFHFVTFWKSLANQIASAILGFTNFKSANSSLAQV